MTSAAPQAVLLIAYGGPTAMAEVRPFLANVLRGRPVPPARLEAVVHHYELIGGRSPLTEITLRQAHALAAVLRAGGLPMPVYVGMRNWTPYLRDTLAQMAADGVRRAVGVIMAAQQSDASWDRYQRDVAEARIAVGPTAPEVDYVDEWHAHPLFVAALREHLAAAVAEVPPGRRADAVLVFTAHSIPVAMAATAPYVAQIEHTARLLAQDCGLGRWQIAYQSRSGNPRDPWLEPDVLDALRGLAADGVRDVLLMPIGFVCDHVEVLYDLDIEARQLADQLGVHVVRGATANDAPLFIRMLADVVRRRVERG